MKELIWEVNLNLQNLVLHLKRPTLHFFKAWRYNIETVCQPLGVYGYNTPYPYTINYTLMQGSDPWIDQ